MKIIQSIIAAGAGIVSFIYLLNPTAGIDLIPDVFPIIGNLDEAAATTILIAALAYFGYDATRLFGRANVSPARREDEDNVIDIEVDEVHEQAN